MWSMKERDLSVSYGSCIIRFLRICFQRQTRALLCNSMWLEIKRCAYSLDKFGNRKDICIRTCYAWAWFQKSVVFSAQRTVGETDEEILWKSFCPIYFHGTCLSRLSWVWCRLCVCHSADIEPWRAFTSIWERCIWLYRVGWGTSRFRWDISENNETFHAKAVTWNDSYTG